MTRTTRNLSPAQQARLRNEAVRLKDAGFDYIQIGRELDVTTIAARDLCMRHSRSDTRRMQHCTRFGRGTDRRSFPR